MADLNNRVVLLTGASQGIGAATARTLAAEGAALIAHYKGRDERSDVEAIASGMHADTVHLLPADFADNEQVEQLWQQAVAWRGRVDVLVLNAAMMSPKGGVDDDDNDWDDAWQAHYQVNVQAPARLMRAAVRHFREIGGGVIILMSSWVAQRGVSNPAMLPYAASKSAIKAVAQSIARGYAEQNILSHIIAPGIVRTRMSTDFAAMQGGEDAVTRTLAMKEWVPPEEVAELIAFLATGEVRHLSGATLDMNGATYIR